MDQHIMYYVKIIIFYYVYYVLFFLSYLTVTGENFKVVRGTIGFEQENN